MPEIQDAKEANTQKNPKISSKRLVVHALLGVVLGSLVICLMEVYRYLDVGCVRFPNENIVCESYGILLYSAVLLVTLVGGIFLRRIRRKM